MWSYKVLKVTELSFNLIILGKNLSEMTLKVVEVNFV